MSKGRASATKRTQFADKKQIAFFFLCRLRFSIPQDYLSQVVGRLYRSFRFIGLDLYKKTEPRKDHLNKILSEVLFFMKMFLCITAY